MLPHTLIETLYYILASNRNSNGDIRICFSGGLQTLQRLRGLLLGAFLANIPHSMDVPISGFSSNAEMLERLQEIDVQGSRYEGPTGIPGVLHDTFSRAKIPVSSLWAAAPHYLAATPNIKVTAALLTYLNTFLSFDLELGDIQADALRFEEQITMLVARDPEASAYVRKLEQQAEGILDEDEDEDEDDEDGIIINPDEL